MDCSPRDRRSRRRRPPASRRIFICRCSTRATACWRRCAGLTRSSTTPRSSTTSARGCRTPRSARTSSSAFPARPTRTSSELAAYLERSPLTHIHVFPYSDRPGTAASAMPGKVHGVVVRERGRRIRDIGRSLTDAVPRVAGRHDPSRADARRRLARRDRQLPEGADSRRARAKRMDPRQRSRRLATRCRGDRMRRWRPTAQDPNATTASCWAGDFFRAFDDQLAAGGADVAAAALADRNRDAVVGEDLREAIDRLIRRPLERNAGARRSAESG